MIGGKRENAGRKSLPENVKRKPTTIYLTDEESAMIDKIVFGNSFSNKCLNALKVGIEDIIREKENKIRFIDLFAGLGGIRLGFEQGLKSKGYDSKCVFSSEIKKHAISAYKNYFGNEDISGDVTKIPADEIPDFDFLLAGFPCQPFSAAGKQLGFKDTRGTLFFEIERILREKRPSGFILENVEGLTTHDRGNTFKTMVHSLEELGYTLSYKVLDSQNFGVAQSRKRIYIVGLKNALINMEDFKEKHTSFGEIQENNKPIVESDFTRKLLNHFTPTELYGKSIKDKRGGKSNIHSWEIGVKGDISEEQKKLLNQLLKERRKKKWAEEIGIKWMDGMPLTTDQIATFYNADNLQDMLDDLVQKGYLNFEHPKESIDGRRVYDECKPKGYNIVTGKLSFEFSKILDPNDVTPTLVATDVEKLGVVDGDGIRKLTVREAQRLCGFPEDYSLDMITYREAMDLLGNTVCVPVIEAISEKIGEEIDKYNSLNEFRNK